MKEIYLIIIGVFILKNRVLVTTIGVLSLFGSLLLSEVSAGSPNSDCSNRCWDNGYGCVCNGYWECYYEPFLDVADDISGFYW